MRFGRTTPQRNVYGVFTLVLYLLCLWVQRDPCWPNGWVSSTAIGTTFPTVERGTVLDMVGAQRMSTMLRTTLLLSLSLLVVPSCKKKDAGDKPATAEKGTAETAPAVPAPTAPAPTPAPAAADQPEAAGTPVATNPKDLFAEFTKPGVDGMALLDKYHAGATFTGKIKSVGAEENGTPVIMLDVDGKSMISVQFTDPAAIKAKKPKAGDSITVTCKIGGASDNLMMVTDCVLK
ncbi:MAG: hypothetical protein JWO36_2221 [Myxococcales bacterium]|nr:hypothetical protein [Myxococcales bacterium]